MTTFNVAVAASADDGDESTGGTVRTVVSSSLTIDLANEWLGFRFQNVTIPNGATINSASVSMVPVDGNNDEPDVTIYGEDVDNSTAFTAGANNFNISGRTRTTASVSWSSTDLGATGSSRHSTSDISSIIQEIVNRAGWASGNALNILITQAGASNRDLEIFFYDNGSLIPELDVDYTAAATGNRRRRMIICGAAA